MRTFLLLGLMTLAVACDKSQTGTSGNASADAHQGQGQEVTADPTFEILLKLESGSTATSKFAADRLAIYEARPPRNNQPQRPQGFELRGENFVLAGALPANSKLAPQQQFEQLINQPLKVLPRGGDPSNLAMSKLKLADGKVYVAKSGTVTINNAFHRKGQYAAVSGTFEGELQEIKLGDTSDPNNRGDQPVGSPVKATGSFSAKAIAYPYEQL
jgi:hypothetical protein